MSSITEARQRLHKAGEQGNWRFKGLLLAALDGSGINREDIAKAWPSSGHPSSYRFLADNPKYDPEAEANRRIIASPGEEHYRVLREFSDESLPKTLAARKPKQLDGDALGSGVDDMIKRALFATAVPEEVDVLFREQLLDVVIDGASKRQIARDAANVMTVDTRKGDIPVAQDGIFADDIAEGAEIRDNGEEYTTVEYETQKYGIGAQVTDEMVRHAFVDIIERQISFIGTAMENQLNRIWLNELVDGAANNFDTEGSNQGVPAINGAYGEVDKDNFIPDTFVTHPDYRTTLFVDSNIAFANRAGTDDVVRERVFDPLLNVEHYGASGNVYNGPDNTWAFGSDGDIGAVVYDREHIHLIFEQDIEIKDYEDPVRDLQGVNARMYVDALYTQQRAASTIEF
jgi:hypothetical protein